MPTPGGQAVLLLCSSLAEAHQEHKEGSWEGMTWWWLVVEAAAYGGCLQLGICRLAVSQSVD